MNNVETLEQLEDTVYNLYGVTSRPAGNTWAYMVLDLARKIIEAEGLDITQDDLEQLTEDNAHTARHAANIALYLKRYL